MKTSFRWNRIAILALIPVFLCLGLVIFGSSIGTKLKTLAWKNDPIKAAEVARSLAGYLLPSGYQEKSYVQTMGISQVILAPADGSDGMTILLIQPGLSLSDQETATEMEDAWAKDVGFHTYQTFRKSSETTTLGGQEATLSYREGKDETGLPVRQLITVFYGKTGWTVLVMVSPLESWNQSLVDEFLQSLS
jgi:hypothetical protein